MKTQLSSLEIAALINEFQILINAKIDQVYQADKKEFLISIHIPRKGKQYLKIQLPYFIYLTQNKNEMPPPTEFSLTLRRHLNNAIIKKIQQLGAERIIEIILEKEQQYKLVIELFSKGNLMLTDKNNQILALMEKQKWGERELKLKQTYAPPPASFDFFKADPKQTSNLIKKSQKSKIVTTLATEIGLGGTYAEEICKINNIKKNQSPKQTTEAEIKAIHQTIKDFIKKTKTPQPLIYPSKDITPFPLQIHQNLPKQPAESFNQALETVLNKNTIQIKKQKKQSQYLEKIKKIKHIVKEQEETIQKLQQQEKAATQKANYIYEKYQLLNNLLKKIKQAKETMSWQDIKKELKHYRQIKNINLKEKKILLKF